MIDSLVNRRTARTVPVLPVNEDGYRRWLRKQSKARKAWLKSSGFRPRGNRMVLVPSSEGLVDLALFGKNEGRIWPWAAAYQRVPPGRYQIEAELDEATATAAAVGWALGGYCFDRYRSETETRERELVWPKNADRAEAARLVTATGLVRDLINTPASDLGPDELVAAVREVAEPFDARVRVVRGAALEKGYPALFAVGRGSARAPRLIDLRWGAASHPKVTLVGKGVCFDSGGLNLKNTSGMLRMKKDMGGAAIALGLAQLIMDAELPVRLRLLIGAVENLPGPHAFRPSDVLQSRKGVTIEVTNTDAEGRLVLADALAEAETEDPDLLIDVATLTGSARVAVGTEITPFFATGRKLAEALSTAGRRQDDPVWRMPLQRSYRRHLESRVADIKNSASTHLGGSILAALFLAEFVSPKRDWLHLDVFGWSDSARPGRPTGGDATGMRALYEMVRQRYTPSQPT